MCLSLCYSTRADCIPERFWFSPEGVFQRLNNSFTLLSLMPYLFKHYFKCICIKIKQFIFDSFPLMSWKLTFTVWEGIVWPPGTQKLFFPILFCFNRVWKQLNRRCDIVVLQHQSARVHSETRLRHSMLFSRNMCSQTTFSLHVGVQHQASIKRQRIRYLGAKGSSSLCLHKYVVKFPASHFKTSAILHALRHFLEF